MQSFSRKLLPEKRRICLWLKTTSASVGVSVVRAAAASAFATATAATAFRAAAATIVAAAMGAATATAAPKANLQLSRGLGIVSNFSADSARQIAQELPNVLFFVASRKLAVRAVRVRWSSRELVRSLFAIAISLPTSAG